MSEELAFKLSIVFGLVLCAPYLFVAGKVVIYKLLVKIFGVRYRK